MRNIVLSVMLVFGFASCNDWLDVRPDTEQKEEDQFASKQGFYDALIGCYMSMADRDVYGERLTMTNIESLANLWYIKETSSRYEDLYLMKHDYDSDYAKSAVEKMYAGLFYVIAQANMVIKYAEMNQDVFEEEATRKVVLGEAYAIRAYCQLDVLRLFGQLPKGATREIALPYSFTTSIYEMPAYYDFKAYVELLKKDLKNAEDLLNGNDPVFEYPFGSTGGTTSDEYMEYRQFRLNYWAVKALRARMCLYLGETDEAGRVAGEIIDAKGPDGKAVMEMSGGKDMPAYNLLPSECLFTLSKFDLLEYTVSALGGGLVGVSKISDQLVLTLDMRAVLFAGEQTGSHNRWANCWSTRAGDSFGNTFATTTKYYYDSEKVEDPTLKSQIIPMLRMSEVYLIAMETSNSLEKINGWYKKYMLAHAVATVSDFASVDDARRWVHAEFRREFFAEGQMFYTYKRLGTKEMLWRENAVTEEEYSLPLPKTEFNPNNLKK